MKKIVDFFSIITSVLFDSRIVLVNTPLQFINFLEFKNLNLSNQYLYKNTNVLILNYLNEEIIKINYINQKYNFNKNNIFKINFYYKLLILILLNFRNIFLKKINTTVIGDYNAIFSKNFIYNSNKVIFLDDGLNFFDFNNNISLNNFKYYFFTFFNKKLLDKHANIIENNLAFFKKKIQKNLPKKKIIFLLGIPAIERNFFTSEQYLFYLQSLKKVFKNYKIFYFPHPKENFNFYKNYDISNIVKSRLPIELFLLNSKYLPVTVVGFNSTSFITLKRMYGKKIKLINFNFFISKKHSLINYSLSKKKFRMIENYFTNYLKIKTVNIRYIPSD